jgi:hypothetical protein
MVFFCTSSRLNLKQNLGLFGTQEECRPAPANCVWGLVWRAPKTGTALPVEFPKLFVLHEARVERGKRPGLQLRYRLAPHVLHAETKNKEGLLSILAGR